VTATVSTAIGIMSFIPLSRAALTYSATHGLEGMIKAICCSKMSIGGTMSVA